MNEQAEHQGTRRLDFSGVILGVVIGTVPVTAFAWWGVGAAVDGLQPLVLGLVGAIGATALLLLVLYVFRGPLLRRAGLEGSSKLNEIIKPAADGLSAWSRGELNSDAAKKALDVFLSWYSVSQLRRFTVSVLLGLFGAFAALLGSVLIDRQNQLLTTERERTRMEQRLILMQAAHVTERCDELPDPVCPGVQVREDAAIRLVALEHEKDPQGIAPLRGIVLFGASLRGSDLSFANLAGADLRGADLRNANLRGAKLSGARLQMADLRGADLSGANLTGSILEGAMIEREATWPSELGVERKPLREDDGTARCSRCCWASWAGYLSVDALREQREERDDPNTGRETDEPRRYSAEESGARILAIVSVPFDPRAPDGIAVRTGTPIDQHAESALWFQESWAFRPLNTPQRDSLESVIHRLQTLVRNAGADAMAAFLAGAEIAGLRESSTTNHDMANLELLRSIFPEISPQIGCVSRGADQRSARGARGRTDPIGGLRVRRFDLV